MLKGERIREMATGKELIVGHDYIEGESLVISKSYDFIATYVKSSGRTVTGQIMYADRGFKVSDEGIVWERKKGGK